MGRHILSMGKDEVIKKCWELFQDINGEIFFPLKMWPSKIKKTFLDKPIGDKETFQVLLFSVGNRCPYITAAKWTLSSNIWGPEKMVKRVYEVQNPKKYL